MARVLPRVSRTIFSRVIFDVNRNPQNLVFLAGPGRSGTTWFSFIINQLNEYPVAVAETSAILSGRNRVTAWRNHVVIGQVRRASEILDRLGLGRISGEDGMPNVDRVYGLMLGSQNREARPCAF